MKLKHNKKQNIGILFSCFSSLYARHIVNQKNPAKLNEIFKKYFIKSDLLKEYKLYSRLDLLKVNDKQNADKFVNIVVKEYKSLNHDKLRKLKVEFLNEISKITPLQEFFSTEIRNYKKLASINQILNESVKGIDSENFHIVNKLKHFIVEASIPPSNIVSSPAIPIIKEEGSEEVIAVPEEELVLEELDIVDISKILEVFRNKHFIFLNEQQQSIMDNYIKIYDEKKLHVYLDSEKLKLIESVDRLSYKDNVVYNTLKSAIKEFSDKFPTMDTDKKTTKLLEAYSLLQQVK